MSYDRMTLLDERDRLAAELAASRALVEQMRKVLADLVKALDALAAVPDRNEDARAGGAEGDTPA